VVGMGSLTPNFSAGFRTPHKQMDGKIHGMVFHKKIMGNGVGICHKVIPQTKQTFYYSRRFGFAPRNQLTLRISASSFFFPFVQISASSQWNCMQKLNPTHP
jgi:hypothetical protein